MHKCETVPFFIWKYITYRLYKNASRTSFAMKFCFLHSLFLRYCLVKYSYLRLSGLFTQVPTRPDNQGSTVRELCAYALTMFLDDLQNNFKIRVCFYYILQIIFKQVLWSVFSTQVRYYFIQVVLCFISVVRLDYVWL